MMMVANMYNGADRTFSLLLKVTARLELFFNCGNYRVFTTRPNIWWRVDKDFFPFFP